MALTKISRSLLDTGISDSSDATAITIDSSENVLIGTSSSSKNLRLQESFGIASTGALGGMAISGYSGTTAANRPLIDIQRSRGTSDESMTVVASGDYLGSIVFRGADGTNFIDGAEISARVDGTPSTSDMPTNLTFHTQADGAGGAAAERMRIDSSGKVGIACTPHFPFDVQLNSSRRIGFNYSDSQNSILSHDGSGNIETLGLRGNTILFYSDYDASNPDGVERMRIDASGLMQMGTTGKTGRINLQPNPSNNHFVEFYSTVDSKVGEINTSTGVQTNYVTSSDYRLKENIVPMEKGLERVNKLKPVKFNWKNDGTISEGFIAHEVQEAGWNEGVIGEKDSEEMQMVDYAKLTPLLVKAIQEQQEQIESLQQEIEVLKNG